MNVYCREYFYSNRFTIRSASGVFFPIKTILPWPFTFTRISSSLCSPDTRTAIWHCRALLCPDSKNSWQDCPEKAARVSQKRKYRCRGAATFDSPCHPYLREIVVRGRANKRCSFSHSWELRMNRILCCGNHCFTNSRIFSAGSRQRIAISVIPARENILDRSLK